LQGRSRLLAVEAKASDRAHRTDARSLVEFLDGRVPGVPAGTHRLGLGVTRGREVERLGPRVWAVPTWRLFGSAA